MDNLVIFKGSVDGITIILDEQAAFDDIIESFKIKLEASVKFLKGAKVAVKFTGRKLSKKEQQQLIAVLKEQHILDIVLIESFDGRKMKPSPLNTIMEQLERKEIALTYYHYGMLRSGQVLDYEGNIVVLGDVNPGAVVTAGGSIIVLGNLKGKAHAGKGTNDKESFIVGLNMTPDLLGIAECIAQSPEENKCLKEAENIPQIAYLTENNIYVDKIDFKTLNHMIE